MTPEIQQRISILRQKIADNTITSEELKEGVALMREGREQMQRSSATSSSRKAKAKAVVQSADEMLDELGR